MLSVVRSLAAPSLVAILLVACGGGNAASHLANAPDYAPKDQSKCAVTRSQSRPLIVEWPSPDRAQLEAEMRRGLVAVRYHGCEMEILACRAKGVYAYSGITRKQDHLTIRDADDLYANVPVGAAKLEATLQRKGELNVAMTIVGRFESDAPGLGIDQLEGNCEGATHYISALTVGAFDFYAGSEAEVGGGASVGSAGVGANSRAEREMINEDGDEKSCAGATTRDQVPPDGCGALIRIEVVPLKGVVQAAPPPPPREVASPGSTPPAAGGDAPPAGCDSTCQYMWKRCMHGVDCSQVGFGFENASWGMPMDLTRSVAFYARGCDAGEGNGCQRAGMAYAGGKGVPKDRARGIGYLRKGCAYDDQLAVSVCAMMLNGGQGASGADEAFAKQHIHSMCDNGNTGACIYVRSGI